VSFISNPIKVRDYPVYDKDLNVNPGTYDYDAYNDLFFMTSNNTDGLGGNDEYFMVYQGKDTTNSALLYMQTVSNATTDFQWVSATHSSISNGVGDSDATYAFVSNGGSLEVWEAFKTPHMTVVPNATAIGHMVNDAEVFNFNVSASNSNLFPDEVSADGTFNFELEVTFANIDNDV